MKFGTYVIESESGFRIGYKVLGDFNKVIMYMNNCNLYLTEDQVIELSKLLELYVKGLDK